MVALADVPERSLRGGRVGRGFVTRKARPGRRQIRESPASGEAVDVHLASRRAPHTGRARIRNVYTRSRRETGASGAALARTSGSSKDGRPGGAEHPHAGRR